MDLLLHRPGSRLINVEHPKVSTLESDFQTCLWLLSYSSRERKYYVTSLKRNARAGKENVIAQSHSGYLKNEVFL